MRALPPVFALDTNGTPGPARMPRRSLLLPHPGGHGRPEVWSRPDAMSSSFAAAPWQLRKAGHRSFGTARVAHSEAECAGVGGQALRFSTQRWLPGFCELRRSSPDNSQCTPHSVGDRQVLPAPIRKTPAFPPTGLRPVGRQKATFSSTGRDAFSFSRKRDPPPQPSEAVAVGKRKAAKRRQRRKKRAGFEEAARLADPKGPGIAMPRRCARGQRSGMRDALPHRASRI